MPNKACMLVRDLPRSEPCSLWHRLCPAVVNFSGHPDMKRSCWEHQLISGLNKPHHEANPILPEGDSGMPNWYESLTSDYSGHFD
jgi:hypothetical protein